jgi:hypothetical protein
MLDALDLLKVGDFVTLTDGVYAGLDGEVIEVTYLVRPWAGRARLKLPCPHTDYWHPFWGEPMDESGWLTTRDTAGLERYLRQTDTPAHLRRLSLFACACARRVLHRIVDPEFASACGRLLEESEALCDRGHSMKDHRLAFEQARSRFPLPGRLASDDECYAGLAVLKASSGGLFLQGVRELSLRATRRLKEADAQRDLLRCVFGNPFRQIILDPTWLAWQNGLIPALARHIHDERRIDEMPVLGDALEDAGCDDEVILAHCRDGDAHIRGCWLLDSILGL